MLIHGDCLEKLKELEDNSVDSIVTDPPYGLSFMGKKWDYDVPSKEVWTECLRVLKPGGYLLSFAGTRTQHRMAVNIEDAGFEIRDMIAWVYGSGFPKSLNIGKAVDKLQGNERKVVGMKKAGMGSGKSFGMLQSEGENYFAPKEVENSIGFSTWEGWGTALKPALEPITVARKPLSEKTVAENVLKWGTGGINIDGSRVGTEELSYRTTSYQDAGTGEFAGQGKVNLTRGHKDVTGRFPANLIHDGSDEVVSLFPDSKSTTGARGGQGFHNSLGRPDRPRNDGETISGHNDSGSAARFFKQCELTEEDIWEQQKLDQTVKSVTNQSDLCETPIAQEVVRTQSLDSKTETLPVSQDSTSNSSDYSRPQNPVQTVEVKQSIDTTQTTQNSLKSSGSAHPVIDVPINQVNPSSDNAPKRFLYQPKASKADRDEGLEGFENEKYTAGNYSQSPVCKTCDKTLNGTNNHTQCSGGVYYREMASKITKNNHPTVKPTKLMQYLVKLVTPKGGVVLDPFMGSGSTGKACKLEGFDFIGIEREEEYIEIAKARIGAVEKPLL